MRAFAFALVLTIPLPAAAQTVDEACAAVAQVTVGQWAEYRLIVPQAGNEPMQMRMAVVGTEAVNGENHHWHELKMAGRQGSMIVQLLVPSFPYEPDDISSIVVKAGDQPAMRMPPEMAGLMARQAGAGSNLARDALKACAGATLVGKESITVPAGTFETLHIRFTGAESGEAWVSVDLPFGLVQMQASGGESMILVGHGMDAKSSITERPQEIPGR